MPSMPYESHKDAGTMARRQHSPEEPSINLTPMIDVVFLLVIFFMVGSRFGEAENRIAVDVPGVGNLQAMVRGPDERVVEVTGDGRVSLDGQPVTLDDLRGQLQVAQAGYPALKVVVRGDASGSFQNIAEVLQVCRSSGVEHLGIAVRSVRR